LVDKNSFKNIALGVSYALEAGIIAMVLGTGGCASGYRAPAKGGRLSPTGSYIT